MKLGCQRKDHKIILHDARTSQIFVASSNTEKDLVKFVSVFCYFPQNLSPVLTFQIISGPFVSQHLDIFQTILSLLCPGWSAVLTINLEEKPFCPYAS